MTGVPVLTVDDLDRIRTALCALMLEVSYRCLPTLQQ